LPNPPRDGFTNDIKTSGRTSKSSKMAFTGYGYMRVSQHAWPVTGENLAAKLVNGSRYFSVIKTYSDWTLDSARGAGVVSPGLGVREVLGEF
jgi:hypothetical protein